MDTIVVVVVVVVVIIFVVVVRPISWEETRVWLGSVQWRQRKC